MGTENRQKDTNPLHHNRQQPLILIGFESLSLHNYSPDTYGRATVSSHEHKKSLTFCIVQQSATAVHKMRMDTVSLLPNDR